MREVLVAVFETQAQAQSARLALTNAGVAGSAVREIGSSTEDRKGGFWSWLTGDDQTTATVGAGTTAPAGTSWRDANYRDEDDRLITEAVSRGHSVLAVHVDDTNIERVIQVLAEQHPISMEEGPIETGTVAPAGTETPVTGAVTSGTGAATPAGADLRFGTAAHTETEQTIPLREEQVEIGKRQITKPVTVRRYVIERPVEEQVTLRDERVEIERRRPVGGETASGGTFEERVVEVHETTEVPVVDKTAKVVEEVVVRKETGERVETVHETVRKEEVEVDRDKTKPVKP